MALLIAVILLGAVQWAYVVSARRDVQKGADLAALTGAQVLLNGSAADCTSATAAATTNVGQNLTGLMAVPATGVSVTCGRWDPNLYPATSRHFSATPAAGVRDNAVEVTLSKPVPSLVPFLSATTVTADSVASLPGTPVAAFSIADTLVGASLDKGALGQLLSGVGVTLPEADLVGYQGLANVDITPSALLQALGIPVSGDISVGDLNSLLAANNVTLGNLLNATLNAAGQQSLLGLNATLLNDLNTTFGVSNLSLALGSTDSGGKGLFAQIVAPTPQSALNAKVNALGVLATAISVATAGHAATVNLSSPTCLLGLLCVQVAAQAIEPAQIGIGGVGTKAYTAQVRTYVHIYTDTDSSNPLLAILGNTNILKLTVDIPIAIDVNAAEATLVALCDTEDDENRDLATIDVSGDVAKACVGNISSTSVFSSAVSNCSESLGPKQLMSLTLLGTPLASVTINTFPLDLFPEQGSGTFYAGEQEQIPADANQLAIGTTVDDIFNALFSGILSGALSGSGSSTGVSTATADQAWNSTAANGCMNGLSNINAKSLSAWNCRSTRRAAAISTLSSQESGLGGYVGTLVGPDGITGILNSVLTLNVGGVLTDLGNTLGTVGNLLGGVLTGILGNPADQCTPTGLLGVPLLSGNDTGCEADIATALSGTTTSGSTQVPNALLGLLSFVYQALQPVLGGLNDLGSFVSSQLASLLGIQIGQNTVTLLSLDCNGKGVQIVY